MPQEYYELMACRLYGCCPSELDEEIAERVQTHLLIWSIEQEVAQLKRD